ncbi:hypothetical protein SNE40_014253 [Patella caerulea]|uniref:Uncharacterized protein n=1 Tax=Patella caerulea TaxID=87958 RepID=A0AAN8JD71_PATCE
MIDPRSCECLSSRLDIFSAPNTKIDIESGKWHEYHPISNLDSGAPIEFYMSGAGEEYLDLAQSFFTVRAKILNSDGTNIADAANVGPVNNFLHSLFSQIDVSLNGKRVSQPAAVNPYRCYLENLLSYGTDAQKSHLLSCQWRLDTPGHFESCDVSDAGSNNGFKHRAKSFKGSKSVDMLGKLHLDLFSQSKYLLNGVDMRLRFVRSKDAFCLMAATNDFKVVIEKASLFIRRLKLNPSVIVAHASALMKRNAIYPIRRVDVKSFTIPAGNRSLDKDNLFLGQTPRRVLVALVTNQAFSGASDKNPYRLQNFDINHISLQVNGEDVFGKPLSPNFSETLGYGYTRAFNTLFSGTSSLFQDKGPTITLNGYRNGDCIFCFDYTPELSDDNTVHLNKTGNAKLEIRFGTALVSTVNVILYSEFENKIEIDSARNVITDF